jgi:hypothetical protein
VKYKRTHTKYYEDIRKAIYSLYEKFNKEIEIIKHENRVLKAK